MNIPNPTSPSPQPSPTSGEGALSSVSPSLEGRGLGGGWNTLSKLLLLATLPLILASCGKRGALIPPEALAPAPISDLQGSQKGESFFISWSAPTEDAAGRPLQDLAGFRLFVREVLPPGEDCEECPNAYRLRTTFDPDYLTQGFRFNDRYFYIDQDIPPDRTFQYMVISYKTDGTTSEASNKVRLQKKPVPPAPEITATSTPATILLQWQPVNVAPPAVLAGYSIYRRTADETYFPPVPLNDKPLQATQHEDIGLDRSANYFYAVRTVVTDDGVMVESPLSNEAAGSLLPPQ